MRKRKREILLLLLLLRLLRPLLLRLLLLRLPVAVVAQSKMELSVADLGFVVIIFLLEIAIHFLAVWKLVKLARPQGVEANPGPQRVEADQEASDEEPQAAEPQADHPLPAEIFITKTGSKYHLKISCGCLKSKTVKGRQLCSHCLDDWRKEQPSSDDDGGARQRPRRRRRG